MRAILICCLALFLVGCNPYAYINVPAVDGDVARNDANAVIVREVESAAVRALLEDDPVDGPFVVKLPEGTTTLTYEVVIPTISERAIIPGYKGSADAAVTFEVSRVQITALNGEVDVRRIDHALGGPGELFTVYMRDDAMEGWYGKSIKRWGMIRDKSIKPKAAPDSTTPAPE